MRNRKAMEQWLSVLFDIENARLWQPKNHGKPNLYETSVELIYKGETLDVHRLRLGVRTVELENCDSKGSDDVGEFCFIVNGKRVFVTGTNWVPLDALHSRDAERLDSALELLDDLGCNAVRCWGGNVYEDDRFFDFCDRHGIMVWQDFAMACGVYPQTEDFAERLGREAIYQIKRLRNHASLILWAGDNEGDLAHSKEWSGFAKNPNDNVLTRDLLKGLTAAYDYARPYLASSPFISAGAYKTGGVLPEDHLWGPRDYFKGDFYKNTKIRFASETGYQGMPSPESLKRFLANPELLFDENGNPTNEYIIHAASAETDIRAPYAYRIRLTYNQILKLFGSAERKFDDMIKQSQISQAEAKKYLIERFRLRKWYCTGIIW